MRPLAGGVLLLALAAGCSEQPVAPEDAYNPADYQGQVDTNLPAAAQEKQSVLKEAFDELQRRAVYALPDRPHLRLTEPQDQFYENGAIALESWKFNGAPQGNEVPVTLVLLYENQETGETSTKTVQRVYVVTGTQGNYTIARKP